MCAKQPLWAIDVVSRCMEFIVATFVAVRALGAAEYGKTSF